MAAEANPFDDPLDLAGLRDRAGALLDALDEALPEWVLRSVRQRWLDWTGEEPPARVLLDAVAAGESARAAVMADLRELLTTDVDAQRSSPLALIRRVVVHPTQVLAANGVPPVQRDADAERLFPDDHYDLSPASFSEVDPSLHDLGIEWGAAKAHVVLRRRRRGSQPT